MENFWKTYIALMIRTQWVTYIGSALMIALVVCEVLFRVRTVWELDRLAPDQLPFIIIPAIALLILFGAVVARIWMVRKSSITNYRPSTVSWWITALGVAIHYVVDVNYLTLHCFFTGQELCLDVYMFTVRPDYAQMAGLLFIFVSGLRAVLTSIAAVFLMLPRYK